MKLYNDQPNSIDGTNLESLKKKAQRVKTETEIDSEIQEAHTFSARRRVFKDDRKHKTHNKTAEDIGINEVEMNIKNVVTSLLWDLPSNHKFTLIHALGSLDDLILFCTTGDYTFGIGKEATHNTNNCKIE